MKLMAAEIRPNEPVTSYFFLQALELRTSRDGRPFLCLTLSDRSGALKGYLWKDPETAAAAVTEGSFVKVMGRSTTIKNATALTIERIRPAEEAEISIGDFLEIVPEGIAHWKEVLIGLVGTMEDADCRGLIEAFLSDKEFLAAFEEAPGAMTVHHSYAGGLLQHTACVMDLASEVAGRYPDLICRDLLMTGAFLHDIGKTRELRGGLKKGYTEEGKLLGHILIGTEMIEEKISAIEGFPGELAMELKHMIISHHGEADYGSPVKPATAEALALHLIDNTDAKLNHLGCHLRGTDGNKPWSAYDRFMGTEIYLSGRKRGGEDKAA